MKIVFPGDIHTFHAFGEAVVDGLLKVVGRHPVSKLTFDSFFTSGNCFPPLRGHNERAALYSCYIGRIGASKPTITIEIN